MAQEGLNLTRVHLCSEVLDWDFGSSGVNECLFIGTALVGRDSVAQRDRENESNFLGCEVISRAGSGLPICAKSLDQ